MWKDVSVPALFTSSDMGYYKFKGNNKQQRKR